MNNCRTLLFVPGNNPGMLAASGALGSDMVIFDLEDAVAGSEKDAARILVRRALMSMKPVGMECAVRINSLDTPHWRADIRAVAAAGTDYILLPKCESPADLATVTDQMSKAMEDFSGSADTEKRPPRLLALVESARGVENITAIAAFGEALEGVLLGAEDLTAELGARRTPGGDEILHARSRVLLACKSAGIAALDSPYPFVTDIEGLARDAAFAAQLGFDGKAVISPHHVHVVNSAFSPAEDQIDWAERVMAVAAKAEKDGKGAVSLDGMMIDLPIIKRARRILRMARTGEKL